MSKYRKKSTSTDRSKEHLDAETRLKQLETFGSTPHIDDTVNVMTYYRHSTDMITKADKQYANNELENAYVSYLKFIDVFHNKIVRHVDYASVPLSIKSTNLYHLHKARRKSKELRAKLLQHFKKLCSGHQRAIKERSHTSDSTVTEVENLSKASTTAKLAMELEAFRSLVTVVLPKHLPTIFQLACVRLSNMDSSVWGALLGKQLGREYVVTHLVIPKQEPLDKVDYGRNPCTTYAAENDLMVLGWIHTHKPASCYLSKTDMRVQLMFQEKLPEAIAVVCAPRYEQVQWYTLLKYGMEYIARSSPTLFHVYHADQPLYTVARHVKSVYDQDFQLVDLTVGQ